MKAFFIFIMKGLKTAIEFDLKILGMIFLVFFIVILIGYFKNRKGKDI